MTSSHLRVIKNNYTVQRHRGGGREGGERACTVRGGRGGRENRARLLYMYRYRYRYLVRYTVHSSSFGRVHTGYRGPARPAVAPAVVVVVVMNSTATPLRACPQGQACVIAHVQAGSSTAGQQERLCARAAHCKHGCMAHGMNDACHACSHQSPRSPRSALP